MIVNWGSEGALTEYLPNGTPIFHTYMDSDFLGVGVENYRGFRYNWTGIPNEAAAVVSIKGYSGTTVYVSWNGDTETVAWRFYAVTSSNGDRSRNEHYLGESPRKGFETSFFVEGQVVGSVYATAIGANGRVLTTTGVANIQAEILPPSNGVRVIAGGTQKPIGW